MLTLQERLSDDRMACGIELVTTRGTLDEAKAIRTRRFASELVDFDRCDWVSITDNAGGNPMLSPVALGKPVLYSGKEVLIHLSCKDFNRNALESEAWQLASEGFHNILALSGDYPISGYNGQAKPVFDIDSVGLLTLLSEMNRGLSVGAAGSSARALGRTRFFLGTVVNGFKLTEGELVPQYLKLEKKLAAGAGFVISQIGYDSVKMSELAAYAKHKDLRCPLIGNVFVLNARVARFFAAKKIPGIVVSDRLLKRCEQEARSPDGGRAFFLELAAKQMAILRGLGYRGVYFGGISHVEDLAAVLDLESSFGPSDWLQFAKEIAYSREGEFFFFERDGTGLSDPERRAEAPVTKAQRNSVSLGYSISRVAHHALFSPERPAFRVGQRLYRRAADPNQGPLFLRVLERGSKAALFACRDCGDCSLPDTAFLCPESECAKNQRNGPCGGTREGLCEVADKPCIWVRAYERLKVEGRSEQLLQHAPVLQDQGLRGTSSWGNTFLGRDHHGRLARQLYPKADDSETREAKELSPELSQPTTRET